MKNLRWQFVHDAIAGTLPSYLKTTKRRSISNGDSVVGIEACSTSSGMLHPENCCYGKTRYLGISQSSTSRFCESSDRGRSRASATTDHEKIEKKGTADAT